MMIVTRLESAREQAALTPNLERAFEFLLKARGRSLPEGRIAIDGERVFALVQSYKTRAGGRIKWEAHQKYIDIQYITAGRELILWQPIENMEPAADYDPDKDVRIGTADAASATPVLLSAGELAVFFPSDAHAPKQSPGAPAIVSKVVVKVAV